MEFHAVFMEFHGVSMEFHGTSNLNGIFRRMYIIYKYI